jgi:hypothetical protein
MVLNNHTLITIIFPKSTFFLFLFLNSTTFLNTFCALFSRHRKTTASDYIIKPLADSFSYTLYQVLKKFITKKGGLLQPPHFTLL